MASNPPLAAWIQPTSSPSILDCRKSTSTFSLAAWVRTLASISARVRWPYTVGSRVPSRFRFGPLRKRIFIGREDTGGGRGWQGQRRGAGWVDEWIFGLMNPLPHDDRPIRSSINPIIHAAAQAHRAQGNGTT